MTSSDLHDLAAAYALDALDPVERSAYEAHLPTCARCRAELASLAPVTAALATAASGPAPSSSLRKRIIDEVRAEAAHVVPLASRRRSAAIAGAVAALAASLAIGLGVWAAATSSELGDTRAALERERAATAVLADPTARSLALEDGEGRLVVVPGGKAVLVIDELAPAPEGKTYQAWVVSDGTPVSAAVFDPSSATGPLLVPLEVSVPRGAVVAVTVEREGGAETPTTEPIAASPAV